MDTFGILYLKIILKASTFEVSRKAKNMMSQYLANVRRVKIKKKTGKISLNWKVTPCTCLKASDMTNK
jgi:hypothetical protein